MESNAYAAFDRANHLLPIINKSEFDSLHGWDFGWKIIEPLDIAKGDEDERELAKRFSPGQKAFYFIRYLDSEVTTGGFIQFYWNNYRKYVPPILEGLRLIKDSATEKIVLKADEEYMKSQAAFDSAQQDKNLLLLYEKLKGFNEYDSIYHDLRDSTITRLERYAKKTPTEFAKFE